MIAVVGLGLAPWLRYVNFRPMTADAVLWIARGAPLAPDWREWVFASRHFNVGYRPVTALSYTFDWWIGGSTPKILAPPSGTS